MLAVLAAVTIGRGELAAYVNALFTVYIILIFIRILLSWVPRMPLNPVLGAVVNFVNQTTDPYLNFFRRFLPPVGGSGFALDLSPVIGVLLLLVGQTVIVGIVQG